MPPRRKPRNDPASPWYSASNEARKRPIVGLTLAPETVEGLAALAKLTGKSRGVLVDELVAKAVAAAKVGAENA